MTFLTFYIRMFILLLRDYYYQTREARGELEEKL